MRPVPPRQRTNHVPHNVKAGRSNAEEVATLIRPRYANQCQHAPRSDPRGGKTAAGSLARARSTRRHRGGPVPTFAGPLGAPAGPTGCGTFCVLFRVYGAEDGS
jgi:hypothetical protein